MIDENWNRYLANVTSSSGANIKDSLAPAKHSMVASRVFADRESVFSPKALLILLGFTRWADLNRAQTERKAN